ncbi:hypothetical protein [uncultured Parasphingorhabdus sp.]|uniref:VOC family protein n=1 Tax=uncultured Parasphingorhabdus sp. TaxID=2709694 RepID=UPI0030D7C471
MTARRVRWSVEVLLGLPQVAPIAHLFRMISQDNGFEEAVGIVADVDASASRIAAATGFVEIYRGDVAGAALELLGMSDSPKVQELLLSHPTVPRGRIRLLSLEREPAGVMRDGAQAWDTGALFDVNLRALESIDKLHAAMGRNGFLSPAPITSFDFDPVSVREVLDRDGDGLCFALMERVKPPLTGFEHVSGPASWVFNATQIVSDFSAARRFYAEQLGWKVVQEASWTHADGSNCMGLPVGLAPGILVTVGVYQAQGRMEGSVEIIQFDCDGLDFSTDTPPQRGWGALRFPVSNLSDFKTRAENGGCKIIGPVEINWAPHGECTAVAAITPWGVRLEAFERQATT